MIATPDIQPIPSCVPPGLFRTVVREISPGLAAADRRAQPRTLYRQGAIYLRSEELPDPSRGDQSVVLVAEPDLWSWNVTTRTGRHTIDPGPELEVHAPILPFSPDLPAPFRRLEFGCEAAFVAGNGLMERGVVPWGGSQAGLYSMTVGDQTVAILMEKRRNAPLLISYLRQGRPVMVFRYDDYRIGMKEQPELFAPPKGVAFMEAPAQPDPRGAPLDRPRDGRPLD